MYRYSVQGADGKLVTVDLQRRYAEGETIVLDGRTFEIASIADIEQSQHPVLVLTPIDEQTQS